MHRAICGTAFRTFCFTLYASLALTVANIAQPAAQAQTFTQLTSFGQSGDGTRPVAGVVLYNGSAYGTTTTGGAHSLGTVFNLTTTGTLKVLENFTGSHGGSDPSGGVVLDQASNIYGTTYLGGSSNLGTVFKLNSKGTETLLHSFDGFKDGGNPTGQVVLNSAGVVYGTTTIGGNPACTGSNGKGCGVVYELTLAGVLTTLHAFAGADGAYPYGGLIQDSSGNLYGTTSAGGAYGYGTVFMITSARLQMLHSFNNDGADGTSPYGGLIADSAGNLYGTTQGGGAFGGGTIYKVAPDGTETVLYSFCALSGCADGEGPFGGLVRDSAGRLYGTTVNGGSGYGVVFKLDDALRLTVLHTFNGTTDSAYPQAGLALDSKGDVYGTTYGGVADNGSVFEVSPN
jgi:uncharacterized repeat protein (TIGR03803 family)